jgi:hypothetical protein
MAARSSGAIPPQAIVHRIGGGGVLNLRLKPGEQTLETPGISVLVGGTPQEAAEQMRQAFPDPVKFARLHQLAEVVGSATVGAILQTGFTLFPDPSAKFPNHARIAHPGGVAGFSDTNLQQLSKVFQDIPTPRP